MVCVFSNDDMKSRKIKECNKLTMYLRVMFFSHKFPYKILSICNLLIP